jgi:uncharacterized protein (TIGR02246 family)
VSTHGESIKSLLNAYRDALVASSVPEVIKLYTPDGIVMPPTFQTQIGVEAVEAWYTACFSVITLDVVFEIKEVEVVAERYAFARTTSAGRRRSTSRARQARRGTRSCSY